MSTNENKQRCTVPPQGWECSREAGHEGPCAASEAAQAFTKPAMPEIVTKALRDGVEYVDATELLTAAMEHLRRIDAFVTTVGVALAGVQTSLIRQGQKLVELEGDMAAEGIAGADGEGQSGIILDQPGLIGIKKGH